MDSPVLILDGGLGTSLEQKYSCKFDHRTPLWSSDLLVSDPALLERCQADFGRVPVDVLLTATYQVSVAGFARTRTRTSSPAHPDGIPRARIPHYIREAVRIAHRAATAGRIALSVGPYGACMTPSQEYSGAYDDAHSSEEALYAWHRDRLALFAAAVEGCDEARCIGFVALETVPRVDEIVAMRRALATAAATSSGPLAAVSCWVSCLFPGDDECLPDGSSVEAAVRAMLDPAPAPPAWGVGINCTKVHKLDALLRKYEAAVEKLRREEEGMATEAWPALVLYPDGTNGEVYNTVTQTWESKVEDGAAERGPWAKQLAEVVRATRRRGRWRQIVVGGCCMAGAEDIAALRAELL
ncbi:hypothetical protein BB8028_0006g08910 [Beauveria bassiana]|uniref:Hcy-binding domain-containing protein n=1 Tax=Beauveria bassiana TaxID=176275 RepID=A0A2S7YL48_BEABA|nr:hypothetical protein BB8028_0006g08910 [Beauveria bassiana]